MDVNLTIPASDTLSQLTTNVLEQTTVLQAINTSQEEKQRGKQKNISILHPSFKKMILFASSEDGTDSPLEPSDLCANFYQQKSAVHAQLHL